MISRHITLPDKTIPQAGLLFSIHLSKRIAEGERGEDSVGHQQADRASDDGESPDVGQQTHTATDEKNEIIPLLRMGTVGVWKTENHKGMLWLAYRQSHGNFQNLSKVKILRKLA